MADETRIDKTRIDETRICSVCRGKDLVKGIICSNCDGTGREKVKKETKRSAGWFIDLK